MIRASVLAMLALVVVALLAYLAASQIEMEVPESEPAGTVVHLVDPPCHDLKHLQEQIKKVIAEPGDCENDTDCAIVRMNCPFGCFRSLNQIQQRDVAALTSKIGGGCHTCRYRCAPLRSEAACVQGRCSTVPIEHVGMPEFIPYSEAQID